MRVTQAGPGSIGDPTIVTILLPHVEAAPKPGQDHRNSRDTIDGYSVISSGFYGLALSGSLRIMASDDDLAGLLPLRLDHQPRIELTVEYGGLPIVLDTCSLGQEGTFHLARMFAPLREGGYVKGRLVNPAAWTVRLGDTYMCRLDVVQHVPGDGRSLPVEC